MKAVENPVTLNLVIYNEPVEIIKRCLDSVCDIVDYMVIYAHEVKASIVQDWILKVYNPETLVFRSVDLDDTVVEEWRNTLISESPSRLVLILDPDEYLDEAAREEVNKFRYEEEGSDAFLHLHNIVAVVWARKNYERTEDGGYINMVNYPDHQIRFIKRGKVTYSGRVHEPPKIGPTDIAIMGRGHIIHDKHYESMDDWHRKADLYRRKEY